MQSACVKEKHSSLPKKSAIKKTLLTLLAPPESDRFRSSTSSDCIIVVSCARLLVSLNAIEKASRPPDLLSILSCR